MTQEDQAIYANLAGTRCVCGARKRHKESFCKADCFRLPRVDRSALYERVGYCNRFRAACKALGHPLPKLPKPPQQSSTHLDCVGSDNCRANVETTQP